MFQLSTNALRALDLEGAVRAERKRPLWGFPSRSVERASREQEEKVAHHLHGVLKRGIELAGAEVLVVPKAKGFRPLTALSFTERTLLRVLTQSLKTELQLPDRTYERYQAFSKAPLEEEGVTHVVRADVASFYQYVDHDILHEEIVNQTGHSGSADSIIEVLHGITQRRIGLPQLCEPSDWLSEVVIDRVERSLIRDGFAVFRFNDDFRVACRDWAEANEAMLTLDHELRKLGLVLNDDKSFPQTRENYQEWNNAPEKAWSAIADELGLDIRDPDWEVISEYARVISPLVGDEVEEESDTDDDATDNSELRGLWVEAARRALEIWLAGKGGGGEKDRLKESIDRRLLRQGLKILTTAREPDGLDLCKSILTTEQHLSDSVGRYMKAVARKDADAVIGRMSDWVKEGFYLSDWQRLWLMEPLLVVKSIPGIIVDWVKETAGSRSNVVRGRALAVLVYKKLIGPDEAATEIDSLTEASSRDLVAAIARVTAGEGRLADSLRRQDALTRLIVDTASI